MHVVRRPLPTVRLLSLITAHKRAGAQRTEARAAADGWAGVNVSVLLWKWLPDLGAGGGSVRKSWKNFMFFFR